MSDDEKTPPPPPPPARPDVEKVFKRVTETNLKPQPRGDGSTSD